MQIQVNTDNQIEGGEKLTQQVHAVVERALGRFGERITRVEVHLSDENGSKSGADDKRCMMEARLEGRPPTAATHRAATVEEAMDGAAGKLARAIEGSLARARQ